MKTAISLIGVFGACTACFGTAGLACGLCLVACLGYAATIYSCMERLEYVPGEGPVDYAYQECDTEIEWIPESEWDEYWDEGEDDKYCDDYDCI